jgi:hypothetical protein
MFIIVYRISRELEFESLLMSIGCSDAALIIVLMFLVQVLYFK